MSFTIQPRTLWRRRTDGRRAIVSHVLGRLVYYRREDDGDLLRLSVDHFRERYQQEPS